MTYNIDLLTCMSLLVDMAIRVSIILSVDMQFSQGNNKLRQCLKYLFRAVCGTTIAASISWQVDRNQRYLLPKRACRFKEVPPHDTAIGKAMDQNDERLDALGCVGVDGIG